MDSNNKTRSGELGNKFYFRTERLFQANHQWFFMSREHTDIGPYKTREQAQTGVVDFVDSCHKRQEKQRIKPKPAPRVRQAIDPEVQWVD